MKSIADMTRSELEAHATRLELERDELLLRGVRVAIRWIREMPRRELVEARMRVGHEVYQRVAASVARHLEERADTTEQPTRPSLPPSSG